MQCAHNVIRKSLAYTLYFAKLSHSTIYLGGQYSLVKNVGGGGGGGGGGGTLFTMQWIMS